MRNRYVVEGHHWERIRFREFKSQRPRDFLKNHALFSKLLRKKKKRQLTEQRCRELNVTTQLISSKALIKQLMPMSKPQLPTKTIQGWNCLRLKVALILCNTLHPVKTSLEHLLEICTQNLSSPRIKALALKIFIQQPVSRLKLLTLTLKQMKLKAWISSNKINRNYLTLCSAILGRTGKDGKVWQISAG